MRARLNRSGRLRKRRRPNEPTDSELLVDFGLDHASIWRRDRAEGSAQERGQVHCSEFVYSGVHDCLGSIPQFGLSGERAADARVAAQELLQRGCRWLRRIADFDERARLAFLGRPELRVLRRQSTRLPEITLLLFLFERILDEPDLRAVIVRVIGEEHFGDGLISGKMEIPVDVVRDPVQLPVKAIRDALNVERFAALAGVGVEDGRGGAFRGWQSGKLGFKPRKFASFLWQPPIHRAEKDRDTFAGKFDDGGRTSCRLDGIFKRRDDDAILSHGNHSTTGVEVCDDFMHGIFLTIGLGKGSRGEKSKCHGDSQKKEDYRSLWGCA